MLGNTRFLKYSLVLAVGYLVGSFNCLTVNFAHLFDLTGLSSTYLTEESSRALPKESSSIVLPPTCTSEQLDKIQEMLPHARSLQRFTACPSPDWLEEDLSWMTDDKPPIEPLLAVFAGCNKGFDAINTLRMLSNNPRYDKSTWRDAMQMNPKGACGQDRTPQYDIKTNNSHRAAEVHCLEAMPVTFNEINQLAETLGWKGELVLHHAALSDTSGTIAFPNVAAGREAYGIAACSRKKVSCENVTMTTLDAYVGERIPKTSIIDHLSIDVEGHDWPVMKGSSEILRRVKFLEFEYHREGLWAKTNLSLAIDFLKPYHFVCYWNGRKGALWRITECFREEYNTMKAWSNVACVNVQRSPELAQRMEEQFNKTLAGQIF